MRALRNLRAVTTVLAELVGDHLLTGRLRQVHRLHHGHAATVLIEDKLFLLESLLLLFLLDLLDTAGAAQTTSQVVLERQPGVAKSSARWEALDLTRGASQQFVSRGLHRRRNTQQVTRGIKWLRIPVDIKSGLVQIYWDRRVDRRRRHPLASLHSRRLAELHLVHLKFGAEVPFEFACVSRDCVNERSLM